MRVLRICRRLYGGRPTSSLLGGQTIVSLVGIWVLDVGFLVAAFEFMRRQPGYVLWPAEYAPRPLLLVHDVSAVVMFVHVDNCATLCPDVLQ